MTGLIASNPDLPRTAAGVVVGLGPKPIADEQIANEAFYPAVSTARVREWGRLDSTATPERLREAVIATMRHCNAELREWAAAQQLQGFATLADLPSPQIAGTSTRVADYLRAIAAGALAYLEEDSRDQATMPAGISKEQRVLSAVATREGTHWRNMRWALADVMQTERATVRVI